MAIVGILAALLFAAPLPLARPQEKQGLGAPRLLWGYVDNIDGLTLTLDDGTTITLTDETKIIKMDGTEGTPADITRRAKAEVSLDAEGKAERIELLPAPLAPEYYLSVLTVRGATTVAAKVGDRLYARSLAALKASFVVRSDAVALVAGVTYQPPKDAKAPAMAQFSVMNAANDVLFERAVKAGEAQQFRLNFPAGSSQTFTLVVIPVGEGSLRPEWCIWLDPKLEAPLPTQQGIGVLQSTARALLADLKRALGETQPGPMAIALFSPLRIRDEQVMRDLQEDLVVAAVGAFQVAGKSGQRIELGRALSDGQRNELTKMGAKCVLVGSVSDRGSILVVNAALVDVASGQILATARAWQ